MEATLIESRDSDARAHQQTLHHVEALHREQLASQKSTFDHQFAELRSSAASAVADRENQLAVANSTVQRLMEEREALAGTAVSNALFSLCRTAESVRHECGLEPKEGSSQPEDVEYLLRILPTVTTEVSYLPYSPHS